MIHYNTRLFFQQRWFTEQREQDPSGFPGRSFHPYPPVASLLYVFPIIHGYTKRKPIRASFLHASQEFYENSSVRLSAHPPADGQLPQLPEQSGVFPEQPQFSSVFVFSASPSHGVVFSSSGLNVSARRGSFDTESSRHPKSASRTPWSA